MADNAYALQMLNSCPGLLCFAVDRNGTLLHATRGYREIARRLLGHECAEGRPYPPGSAPFGIDLRDMIREAFLGETAAASLEEAGGNKNEWAVTCAPLTAAGGQITGAIVSLTPLPGQSDHGHEAFLQTSTADPAFSATDFLEAIPGMFFAADEAGRCVYAGEQFLSALKYPKEAVLGRPFTEFLPEGAGDVIAAGLAFDNLECTASCGDGSVISLSLSGARLQWDAGMEAACMLISCADNTKLRRAEEQLKRASVTDASTGMLNRQGMELLLSSEAERAARYGSPLSMLILDIDGFRKLNERLGYSASDTALKELTAAIKKCVRLTDFPGRWGGDEFMILTPAPPAEAAQLAETLRRAAENMSAGITLSAGVAEFRSPMDISSFVGAAYDAMIGAKKTGGNRTVQAKQS